MLYTGKGDDGKTGAFGCNQRRIAKSSDLPEALGSLDELNALLGVVRVRAGEGRVASALRAAQEQLFVIQAQVAGAGKCLADDALPLVEAEIARIESEIAPVTGFSVAGGTELSAMLDHARAVARRAERRLLAVEEGAAAVALQDRTKAYLNRLSSLLFALARLANHEAGIADERPRY